MEKTEIFGIKFDNLEMNEVIERIQDFVMEENSDTRTSSVQSRQHYIVLPYSELVVRAQKNKEFRSILNQADLCLCESRGLYLIARILGKKLKQEINGIELIQKISNNQSLRYNNQTIFLFGGEQEIVEKTAEKLGNNIVGFENGYQNYDLVIQKINLVKPEILLVGLGSPKQEQFIAENLSKMPSVKLAIGVGGAFDFISGRVRRAPKVLQKIGLEWLWRLIREPRRIKRIFSGVTGLVCLTFKYMLFLNKKRS